MRDVAPRQQAAITRAPSSSTTLPGGRPGVTRTMKTVNNSNETASPRGGVGSIVKRTRSTATQVNTIRLKTWTSLRLKGEVLRASARQARGKETDGPWHGGPFDALDVVGGSRLGKGSASEDRRPAGTGSRKTPGRSQSRHSSASKPEPKSGRKDLYSGTNAGNDRGSEGRQGSGLRERPGGNRTPQRLPERAKTRGLSKPAIWDLKRSAPAPQGRPREAIPDRPWSRQASSQEVNH